MKAGETVTAEYLPRSRRVLPPEDGRRPHSSKSSGLFVLAASPFFLGLCLMVALLLIFPKALGDGLTEGSAV